jgi:hypothetical protein
VTLADGKVVLQVKLWGSKPVRSWHTCQPKPSSSWTSQLGDVWEGKTFLGPGLPGCLCWNVLLSLGCKPQVSVCPLLGSQHPFGGILALWRFEIMISPCVPVCRQWSCSNNKYALHGLISHRDHRSVNHI